MEVVIGDRRVSYLLKGSRPDTIVFLPSLGTTAAMWVPQIDVFSRRYTVVAPEFGGHNGFHDGTSLEGCADDLEAVLDAVGSTWVHIVGISMGGMIAQHFGIRFPDRVRSLVLVNTTCRWTDDGRQRMRERADLVEREGMHPVVDGLMARWFTDSPFEQGSPGRGVIRSMLLQADPRSYAAAARAVSQIDTCEHLSRIVAKALVVRAESDASMPDTAALELSQRILRAELVSMPELAHLCTVQAPQSFNSLLGSFLDRVEAEAQDDIERTEPAHPW
jgi:pimeloyl-ACP methyl ester carboxylesterase